MITLPQGRITEKKCEAYCSDFNAEMENAGLPQRVSVNPRYGYCAVDEYVETDGKRTCMRNVETGSPRECCEAVRGLYYQLMNKAGL